LWQDLSMGTKNFDLVTLVFDLLKTLTLAISFEWYILGLWYFTWENILTRPFRGYQTIWPSDLDHGCLTYFLKTLTLATSFEWYFSRTLIFHMSVPCDKTFFFCGYQQVWPCDTDLKWCLTYSLKTLVLAISFEWYVQGLWYSMWVFLVTRTICGYQQIRPCDFDLGVWPPYLNGI
jgi:hypothetical protein